MRLDRITYNLATLEHVLTAPQPAEHWGLSLGSGLSYVALVIERMQAGHP
jgi:hypothetical protein